LLCVVVCRICSPYGVHGVCRHVHRVDTFSSNFFASLRFVCVCVCVCV